MPNEPRADNGDSCCHEIGLCLTDECTALDKPLHGWIESDPLHLVRGTRVHRSMTAVKIVHLLATRFRQVTPSSPRCWSQQSRISAPNSSCGQTSTARHESCCRNGQPRRWSAPASEELAKEGAFDSFDNMLLPTSRIMRAAREKIMQTSQRPRVLHHSQLCRCLRRQKHVGLLCHRKCLMRARSRVLLWPPRSVPQSCRLIGSRTQHLHRLQVASSGLSQTVPRVSCLWTQVSRQQYWVTCTNKYLCPCCAWQSKACSSCCRCQAWRACESDTEPRLHLRLAEPRVTAMSILLWLLSSRNPRPVLHQDLSSMVTRRATSCASSSNILTVCVLGIVFGENSVFHHRVRKSAPWEALTTSILNTWSHGSLRITSSHTFNKPRIRWKHPNTNIMVNTNR